MSSNKKIEKFNSLISKKNQVGLKKPKWREENKGWPGISFAISVKILVVLRNNKRNDLFLKNQKELAAAMDCTPQYINKLLKGTENLQLETISKLGATLGIKLSEVPQAGKTIMIERVDVVKKEKFTYPVSTRNISASNSSAKKNC